MHRVHHSILRHETDSNFGFNLPWWDRLFGTYRPQPEAGHDRMTIGLPIFRDPQELRLDRLLTQPFRDDTARATRRSSGDRTANVTANPRIMPWLRAMRGMFAQSRHAVGGNA